jgi:hypothetical protein
VTPRINRRDFLALTASASAASAFPRDARALEAAITGTLSIDANTPLHTLPLDFTGLSYEAAQLANPAFFSAANKPLIALFRELSPRGVLRIGGGSSEFTTYSSVDTAPTTPPPFETFGPDTSKTVKSGTTTTAFALRNLRGFLDATGWSCIYGLNLGQGTKENAATEAEAAYRILGPHLTALQIGNEPDSFRNRYRPATYGPDDFIHEWLDFHAAIVARVPAAKFAGPDISNKLTFLTAFAAEAPKHADVIMLTGHYYAMGPAGNPGATLDNLLSPNPALTTLKWPNVSVIQDAMRTAKLPFRMSEGNSCWNGGQAGVSDVFASALWCADVMLHFASLGFSGVNMHGGGNGIYSPIVGSPSTGFSKRPEYFGMAFAQHFAGATLLSSNLQCTSDRVATYAARTAHDGQLIAIMNKTTSPLSLTLTGKLATQSRWRGTQLTGPSLDAKTGIVLTPSDIHIAKGALTVTPHTALLLSNR